MHAAYTAGADCALEHLGLKKLGALGPTLRRALGGAALGAGTGYMLSPEDRKGTGTLYGAGLGGAGAALGHAISPLMHDARSAQSPLGRRAIPALSSGLGALAGIGASQAFINKDIPDTAENPYRY